VVARSDSPFVALHEREAMPRPMIEARIVPLMAVAVHDDLGPAVAIEVAEGGDLVVVPLVSDDRCTGVVRAGRVTPPATPRVNGKRPSSAATASSAL
jgi:hypothetical protein